MYPFQYLEFKERAEHNHEKKVLKYQQKQQHQQWEDVTNKRKSLEQQISQLEQQSTELQKELEDLDDIKNVDKFQESIKKLSNDIEKETTIYNQLTAEQEQLQQQVESIKAKVAEYKEQLEETQIKSVKVNSVRHLKETIDNLSGILKEKQAGSKLLDERAHSLRVQKRDHSRVSVPASINQN